MSTFTSINIGLYYPLISKSSTVTLSSVLLKMEVGLR